ncbi:MAG TPA: ABC transporter permease [Candidatus Dormibacteraeota bacterium]|jgi:peptide/nickel transport system permease protein|nr:ABC transporter permease [Candidatus Dormibacteraeota bacterium]
MWKYIVKRLALGALTVLVITFVVYGFLWLLPEKPYAALINRPNQPLETKLAIIHRFGADQPFFVQYWTFLKNILKPLWTWWGLPPHAPQPPDLGESIPLHSQVFDAIRVRMPATAELMLTSYVLTLLIAVPVGIISAVRQYSKLDNAVTSLSFLGISLPNYWFGSILIYLLADLPYQHGFGTIFPASGQHTGEQTGLLDLMWHLTLPVLVLAVQSIAGYARFIRSSMLETLNQDYVRTARAKGLANRRVVVRHAFRNSLLPFITLLGLDIPTLFVGAVITEFVFSWPGMGQLFVIAADGNDYSVLLGILLILSTMVVLFNLLADIAYTWADPRISYERTRA